MLELLALVVVVGIGYWTYRGLNDSIEKNHAEPTPSDTPVAPVLTQAQTACGCGRSKTGYCVGLHKLSEEDWAVHEDNPNKKKARKPRAKKDAA